MRLIGVVWGEDRGVVDLDTAKVIMYVYGKFDGGHFDIPFVDLEDADFVPLLPEDGEGSLEEDNDALYDVANWENVPALLTLSSFNLAGRLIPPEARGTPGAECFAYPSHRHRARCYCGE